MCFLIGATGPGVTADGGALLGGVSDDPYLFRTFVRVVPPPAAGKLAHLGTELRYVAEGDGVPAGAADRPPPFEVEPGQPSRGINAAGLAFTCALAIERAAGEGALAGQPFSGLCHRMMAECTTVEEAVALLSAAGAVAPAFSVLLADAGGGLVQMEVGAFGCAVHRRYSREQPGVVVAVNCHQCKELVEFNRTEAQLDHSSNNNGVRLRRGWELAKHHLGRIDVACLAAILADHHNRDRACESNPLIAWWGHSICNHGTRKQSDYVAEAPPWGSVSAEIFEPARRGLHYCYGWPCGEAAEFGDQLFQSGSWGKFEAFVLPAHPAAVTAASGKPEVVECTTVDGKITAGGEAFLWRYACDLGA